MQLDSTQIELSPQPQPLQPLAGIKAEEQDLEALRVRRNWLNLDLIWGKLQEETLQAIAACFQVLKITLDTEIYQEHQTPVGVYLVRAGTVEIFRVSPLGKSHLQYRSEGELFGYLPLMDDLAETTYQANAIALTESELWFLPKSHLQTLLKDYPDLQTILNHFLIQDITELSQLQAQEQLRIAGLQAYLQPITQGESLIGTSKASQKVTQQIQTAASHLEPILFQALPGTGKTFLAGWIHAHSKLANYPFIELDCATLPRTETGELNTDLLFGKAGESLGVLGLLSQGTALISNIQLLSKTDRDRLIHLLNTGYLIPNPISPIFGHSSAQSAHPPTKIWVRLILAAPEKLKLIGVNLTEIKLFSLAQRKVDIPEFAEHFLEKFSQESCRPTLQIDRADLRRLISYDYPGNLTELAAILKRAITMTPLSQTLIPEQVLWSVQSQRNSFRVDLLTQYPWLRKILLNRWYPQGIWLLMMAVFIPVIIIGLVGPQNRGDSITLNLFWAWWWPGYLFFFAFIGRLWCAVCPFMITGEWLRNLSLWLFPRQLLPWPTKWLNRWGAWVLWAGFLLIYLWEKLWDLPHHAALSAWLLMIIAAGATLFSLIYERRLWCRYLCPIGGMNGMFAKLSLIELRSNQAVCGSQCHEFGCYKGRDSTGVNFTGALSQEGQSSAGCPLYSHPAQLQDNRDCVLCMACLKTCPNRSVQLNFRFPAADLLEQHRGFWAEVALLLLLLGGVCMHHADRILGWVGLADLPLDSEHLEIAIPVVIGLLSLPAGLIFITHAIARWFDPEFPDFLTLAYAYLPLTLAANLADYIPAAITEAGQFLPILARSFGAPDMGLLTLTWSADVAAFLQGVTLLSILAFSPYPLLRISQRPWLSNLPHLLLLVGMAIALFQVLI